MSDKLNSFGDLLRKRLTQPLPGERAYQCVKVKRPDGGAIKFNYTEQRRESAVLIAFYEKRGKLYFPLIQRPSYDGVHSGQIALPGGKREISDKDLIHTALREAEEEIGIQPTRVKILGALTSFYVAASNFQVLPVVGVMSGVPLFNPDPDEVASIIEGPLEDFLHPSVIKEKMIDVRGFSILAPYFDVKDQVIWGATAAMLSELMMIIEEIYE
jgi:8-oxo-dGTP pyrophosphatase MutT (NUDIX family)